MANVRQDATNAVKPTSPRKESNRFTYPQDLHGRMLDDVEEYLALSLSQEDTADPQTLYRAVGMMSSPTFLEIAKKAGFSEKAIRAEARCHKAGTDKATDSDMDASYSMRWFAARLYVAGWIEAMDLMCSNRK